MKKYNEGQLDGSQAPARSSGSINTSLHSERQTEYKLHGHTLEVVNNGKYLGVNIRLALLEADRQMKFTVAQFHPMRVTNHKSFMTALCISKFWKTSCLQNTLALQ